MVDIIAPRRGENVTDKNGLPTVRFYEYLEAVATQTNKTTPDTDVDTLSISQSVAEIGAIKQKILEIEAIIGDPTLHAELNVLKTKIMMLEMEVSSALSQMAKINSLQRQIDEIRILVT